MAGAIGYDAPDRCILEPGRLLVADAFHLIARVTRLKGDAQPRFAVLDAGRAQNGLFVARGYHEILAVAAPEGAPTTCYTIVGPLCAAFDTFAQSRGLPELAEGDLIAILDVGAYNLSAQSNWSFDPAPVIALRDGVAVRTPTLS
jgi:diaminopimelate decarboxylase